MSRGFTFIELIVVVAIVILLTGSAITAMTKLRDKREAQEDAGGVELLLRSAQRRALAGEKPAECDGFGLAGYSAIINPNNVALTAVCAGGTPPSTTTNFGESVLSSTENPIVFNVLTGAATPAAVDICRNSRLYRISVNAAGLVETPEEVPGGC